VKYAIQWKKGEKILETLNLFFLFKTHIFIFIFLFFFKKLKFFVNDRGTNVSPASCGRPRVGRRHGQEVGRRYGEGW
jgi:hypothetical protein